MGRSPSTGRSSSSCSKTTLRLRLQPSCTRRAPRKRKSGQTSSMTTCRSSTDTRPRSWRLTTTWISRKYLQGRGHSLLLKQTWTRQSFCDAPWTRGEILGRNRILLCCKHMAHCVDVLLSDCSERKGRILVEAELRVRALRLIVLCFS